MTIYETLKFDKFSEFQNVIFFILLCLRLREPEMWLSLERRFISKNMT